VTSDFLYLRLHGESELYASGYTEDALDRWADRIRRWAQGEEPEDAHCIAPDHAQACAARDVYCYFDNDAKVRAPFDAQRLMQKLGLSLAQEDELARSTRAPVSLVKGNRRDAKARRAAKERGQTQQ
jgi:uncharacterized protein YecE (DUF72 family)